MARSQFRSVAAYGLAVAGVLSGWAAPAGAADALEKLRTHTMPEDKRNALGDMVRENLRDRLRAANARSTAAWRKVKTRQDWQRFRDDRLKALRESLGTLPAPPEKLSVRVARKRKGDGYGIENLLFESRPGLWVTANLYLPVTPPKSMPGILLCHSHHAPKHQRELQDMGMTWARAGCAVLVMDQLGHGERRQHPFRTAADFRKGFRVGRQDYYFRYDAGIQLHLVGESLMGWMAWDLMRGVDLLLGRRGVDPKRIILLGCVAGGGDPAAVAAALDRRISAVVPYNFGGPQPETRSPLPADAEASFNYAGSGSWESTRNLRRSGAEGFLPWVIVGAAAPRPLIYAHEFAWDRQRDPVWKRLETIYGFYDAAERLAFAFGRGSVRGRPPESTHCGNIGAEHRKMIHPAFRRWFGIAVTPGDEYSNRREAEELLCITPKLARELKPRRLCDLLPDLGAARLASARKRLAGLAPAARRRCLRADWARVLGDVKPGGRPKAEIADARAEPVEGAEVTRIALRVEPGIVVPVLLLRPTGGKGGRLGVVVAVAQAGKAALLRRRAKEVAALLAGGAAVCLPDVRGTGETRASRSRGRYSEDVPTASAEQMLGGTMLGARLRDLRAVLTYLRGRSDVDAKRIALWGDSLAAVNPGGTDFKVPRHMDGRPKQSEPLGGLLALLGGLFEDDVCAVCVLNGLSDFHSVLPTQFVQIPYDVVVPGVLTAGDLPDVAAAIAPRPLRLDGLVDGLNRRLSAEAARALYRPGVEGYRAAGAEGRIAINRTAQRQARWLLEQVGGVH